MSDFKLKVSPDVLQSKAQELEGQIQNFQNDWKKIKEIIKNSKSYWQGEASDMHQKYEREVQDDVSEVVKNLKEHPKDLLAIAGIFRKTESELTALANELPGDVII